VKAGLVLSLFPGIGLLDRAFEEEGFCVVRGPDLLWGGDIHRFAPPSGVFQGIIGGPPCQCFSPIGNVNRARYGADAVARDLIPEFRRVVAAASPDWWLMENSPYAYSPFEGAYRLILDTAWLGERQARRRAFWSSLRLLPRVPALVSTDAGTRRAVGSRGTVDWAGSRRREGPCSLEDVLELQGLPRDYLRAAPFTRQAGMRAVGNGVPLPMGRVVACAVREALEAAP